jgi:quercetin dioxygenase-like cupin family protein
MPQPGFTRKLRQGAALVWSAGFLVVASWTTVHAMWQPPASARRSTGRATSLGTDNDRFTRTQWQPGGRTFWHVHPRGQIILAQEGHVRVQMRGRPAVDLVPGDEPVYTPPNVAHWHGAAPTDGGTYLATTPGGEADVTWLEEVTADEYARPAVPGQKAQ